MAGLRPCCSAASLALSTGSPRLRLCKAIFNLPASCPGRLKRLLRLSKRQLRCCGAVGGKLKLCAQLPILSAQRQHRAFKTSHQLCRVSTSCEPVCH